MKNTDLLAGLSTLLALMVIGGVRVFAGHDLVSQDLQVALGAFLVAALGRWRLSVSRKPQEALEPGTPAEAASEAETPPTSPSETPTIPAPPIPAPPIPGGSD